MSLYRVLSRLITDEFICERFCPILLYHSVGAVSSFESDNIDHVSLELFESHIRQLKTNWDVVTVDELVASKEKKGLAAITFDDGYKNVITEALPVLERYQVPATVFINTCSFKGIGFWRDKIRFLLDKGLMQELLSFSERLSHMDGTLFYSQSKSHLVSSRVVASEIDSFLEHLGVDEEMKSSHCFDGDQYMIDHPLLWYGNHTANHYYMSSLTEAEQFEEIESVKSFIEQYKVQRSKVLSVPFGGHDSYNSDTVKAAKSLGYNELLLTENRLARSTDVSTFHRIHCKGVEDLMAHFKVRCVRQLLFSV